MRAWRKISIGQRAQPFEVFTDPPATPTIGPPRNHPEPWELLIANRLVEQNLLVKIKVFHPRIFFKLAFRDVLDILVVCGLDVFKELVGICLSRLDLVQDIKATNLHQTSFAFTVDRGLLTNTRVELCGSVAPISKGILPPLLHSDHGLCPPSA